MTQSNQHQSQAQQETFTSPYPEAQNVDSQIIERGDGKEKKSRKGLKTALGVVGVGVAAAVAYKTYTHIKKKKEKKQSKNESESSQSSSESEEDEKNELGVGSAVPLPEGLQVHGPSAATNESLILKILEKTVAKQNLFGFYPPGSLNQLVSRISSSGVVNHLVQYLNLPLEAAMDLCKLALYDTVLYLDDSASMTPARQHELKRIFDIVVGVTTKLDIDGISVRWMNSSVEGNGIKVPEAVSGILEQVGFDGFTPMGSMLKYKIVEPMVLQRARYNSLPKPVLVVTITDGEPTGEPWNEIINVLVATKQELAQTRYGSEAIAVQLAQVGNEPEARRFLEKVQQVGTSVHVTSSFEDEAFILRQLNASAVLTSQLWVCKLLLGAIDPHYDISRGQVHSTYVEKWNHMIANPQQYREWAWDQSQSTETGFQVQPPPVENQWQTQGPNQWSGHQTSGFSGYNGYNAVGQSPENQWGSQSMNQWSGSQSSGLAGYNANIHRMQQENSSQPGYGFGYGG